jgi:SAM-dependent methyltransferase
VLDPYVFRLIQEKDFGLMPALSLRSYSWASLAVYDQVVRDRMKHYRSKYDLLGWFKFWTEQHRLASPFDGQSEYESYRRSSTERHEVVLRRLFSTLKDETRHLHGGYDIWNAIDSQVVFSQCKETQTILDYGAGYGRLGLAFFGHPRVKNYIGIDSIELSYMLQNLVLSAYQPERFYEYFDFAMENKPFEALQSPDGGIYHLPMWKWDLIPDASVDVVTSVFVLPEINEFSLLEFMAQATRTVKKNGYIYLRDHLYHTGDKNHVGAHRFDTEALLEKNGFKKIYQPDYADNVEIYGTPRVYQKTR